MHDHRATTLWYNIWPILKPGRQFEICEDARTVGRARIVTVLGVEEHHVMRDHQDAYGHEVLDCLRPSVYEIVERDDGYFDAHLANGYLSPHADWASSEQEAMRYVRGRVLDVGCGAARHSLYLQEKGFDVTGIDVSPLAIEVCRERGLRHALVLSVSGVSARLGTFDTILMMGNNFGLFTSAERAKRLLRRFHRMTTREARIVVQARDPYETDNVLHLAYHRRNWERGRMGGQLRIRVRYQTYVSPWFDYLLVSRPEMERVLEGTGWRAQRYLGVGDPSYIAIIEKDSAKGVAA